MNPQTDFNNSPARSEIELRAFQLWCEQGCPPGTEVTNWLEAERQLVSERSNRITSSATGTANIPRSEDVDARLDIDGPTGVERHSTLGSRVQEELVDPGRPNSRSSKTSVEL